MIQFPPIPATSPILALSKRKLIGRKQSTWSLARIGIEDITCALVLAQLYASQVIRQPGLCWAGEKRTRMTELSVYQTRAKRHAQLFLQTLSPKVLSGLMDLVSYGHLFDAFYTSLEFLLEGSIQNDLELNQPQILSLLEQLETEANKHFEKSRKLSNELQVFRAHVDYDRARYIVDAGLDTRPVESTVSVIERAQMKIDRQLEGVVREGLINYNCEIQLAVGILPPNKSCDAANEMPIAGIGASAYGADEPCILANKLTKNGQKLAGAYRQAFKLNQCETSLQVAKTQGQGFANASSILIETWKTGLAQWQCTIEDLRAVKKRLVSSSSRSAKGTAIKALRKSNTQWRVRVRCTSDMIVKLNELRPSRVGYLHCPESNPSAQAYVDALSDGGLS